ncbi:hypothetical protein BEWA_009510 [Theileria equi strain WA]|uniref:Peptidase S9 prolyl oligopeptidase catalytic domain-containing protein n=1 Tax=Theileria equi strain WA TaxID=1537102 RepID=L0B0Z8_THEEQ|nr:hypothetical protein BEWA_009510 [Theileria equi strain WA]AFZ81537.1 hypothetical protein BEWA_009510 [Theileria equi strain WA]|eukprot:XP_004831203.1 hypothetical protein BEWA_009510 [Theileria equi strain WA]
MEVLRGTCDINHNRHSRIKPKRRSFNCFSWYIIFITVFSTACVFSICKNAIVNHVSFGLTINKGYEIADDGSFIVVTSSGRKVCAKTYLRPYNLDCSHVWIQGENKQRISALIIYHIDEVLDTEYTYGKPYDSDFFLFSHGNNTDIGHMFYLCFKLCLMLKVNLVSYDYSGYGYSTGKTTERNLYENIVLVYDYLVEQLKVESKRIILYGNSIGSATSCYIASHPDLYPIGGLILHSPLASGLRIFFKSISKSHWFDAFNNIEFLKKSSLIPIFIIHGTCDSQIPLSHAIQLACIVKERHDHLNNIIEPTIEPKSDLEAEERSIHKNTESVIFSPKSQFMHKIKDYDVSSYTDKYIRTWWVEGADHNNIEVKYSGAYYEQLLSFLDLCRHWRTSAL